MPTSNDSLLVSDSLAVTVWYALTDTGVGVTDTAARLIARIANDSVDVTDTTTLTGIVNTRSAADAVDVIDAILVTLTVLKSEGGIGITETMTGPPLALAVTISDTAGLTDPGEGRDVVDTITEALGVPDGLSVPTERPLLADPVGLSDSVAVARNVVLIDQEALVDTPALKGRLGLILRDGTLLTDVVVVPTRIAAMRRGVTYHLNRLAGTLVNDAPQLADQSAANVWAGTDGLGLVGALNVKAGIASPRDWLGLRGVCNLMAGTTGEDADEALSRLAP